MVLYARQWCNCPDDALQEALVDLARLEQPPVDMAAWLFTTVRRKAINLARSEGRRKKHQQQASLEKDTWFSLDPSDRLLGEELENQLRKLSPLEREILVARIWGELTFEQIAALVALPLSSVYRQYQKSLSFLGVQLGVEEVAKTEKSKQRREPGERIHGTSN